MSRDQICPNCRSTFEINGRLDFMAPAISIVNCPVCSQEQWVASGLPPYQWSVGRVITRIQPIGPPLIIAPPSADDTKSVFADFKLPGQDQVQALGAGIYNIGVWVVVVLVLVLLIRWSE